MMRKITALLALFAILMASCSTQPGQTYSWCYTYDFATSDHGVQLTYGSWIEGEGLRTDSDSGRLSFDWTYDQLVEPKRIDVTFVRPPGAEGDIFINTDSIAFGAYFHYEGTVLPLGQDHITIGMFPDVGSDGLSASVTLDTYVPVSIASIKFFGDYGNPFPSNECIGPTLTASATEPYFPVVTATWTSTPLPTLTPEPLPDQVYASPWIHQRWHFTQNLFGPGYAEYPDGQDMGVHPQDAEFIGVIVRYYDVDVTEQHTGPAQHMTFDFRDQIPYPQILGDFNNYGSLTWNTENDAACYIRTVRPFSGLPDWTVNASTICDTYGLGGEALYYTGTTQSVHVAGTARNAFTFHWSNQDVEHTGRFRIRYLYYGEPETPTQTPTLVPSVTPSRTPFLFPTRGTPNAGLPTEEPTGTETITPTGTYYPEPTAFITPTADPEGNGGTVENEAEWTIFDFIGYIWNELKNGTYDILKFGVMVFYWVRGTAINVATGIDNIGKTLGGFFEGLSNLATDMYMTGQLTLDMSRLLLEISFGWFNEGITRINVVMVQFFNTPAISIPGLPQCVSNPTEHQLCAIWWTLDWTLFAPATPGALIVPLLTIMLNVGIVLYFVQMILKIVRKMGTITDV